MEADSHSSKENSGTFSRVFFSHRSEKCFALFSCLSAFIIFSVTMCPVIGQLSGLYSTVRPAKIKAVFVTKTFRDSFPCFLNSYGT